MNFTVMRKLLATALITGGLGTALVSSLDLAQALICTTLPIQQHVRVKGL